MEMEVTPQEVKHWLDSGQAIVLVDVREPFEHAVARIEDALLIPMNTIPGHVDDLREKASRERIVVLCHHGVRSLNVVQWLRRQGIENTWSMAGGIDLWSVAIDPSTPRY